MWKCEKCETINDSDVCAICGEKRPIVPNAPEQNQNRNNNQQVKVDKEMVTEHTTPSKKDTDNRLLLGVLIGIIIVLLVVISSFMIYFFVVQKDDDNHERDRQQTVEMTEMPEAETTGDDNQNPSSTIRPMPGETTTETINQQLYPADFVYGVSSSEFDLYPTYTRVSNSAYSWYCDIPDNFEQYVYGSQPCYRAMDGTAIMRIEARPNDYGDTVEEVRADYINSMNGVDQLKAKGSDWFASSFTVNGITYYKKCYVDHYIRSFEFVFPKEYLDMHVYDEYIEHIEDNFKRTDV